MMSMLRTRGSVVVVVAVVMVVGECQLGRLERGAADASHCERRSVHLLSIYRPGLSLYLCISLSVRYIRPLPVNARL